MLLSRFFRYYGLQAILYCYPVHLLLLTTKYADKNNRLKWILQTSNFTCIILLRINSFWWIFLFDTQNQAFQPTDFILNNFFGIIMETDQHKQVNITQGSHKWILSNFFCFLSSLASNYKNTYSQTPNKKGGLCAL